MSCSTNGSFLIVIIFKIPHGVCWRGGGQWSPTLIKCLIMLHFHTGSVKSTFSKYYFGREGGGHKRSALCTLFIMLTIMYDP